MTVSSCARTVFPARPCRSRRTGGECHDARFPIPSPAAAGYRPRPRPGRAGRGLRSRPRGHGSPLERPAGRRYAGHGHRPQLGGAGAGAQAGRRQCEHEAHGAGAARGGRSVLPAVLRAGAPTAHPARARLRLRRQRRRLRRHEQPRGGWRHRDPREARGWARAGRPRGGACPAHGPGAPEGGGRRSVGIGFAIPVNLAKPVVTQLASAGHVTRGWLGVGIQPLTADLAKSFRLTRTDGALVTSVSEGSPAAKAGLKEGDVIVEYDGRPVARAGDLPRTVAETPVGRAVPLKVVRDGKPVTLTATVGRL